MPLHPEILDRSPAEGARTVVLAFLAEARERWDRAVEDALSGARRDAENAREAWKRARSALHEAGSALPVLERRALLLRAEREHRRRLEELRGAETVRLAEKDRALLDLRRRAEARGQRKLVATARWRCA